MSQLISMVRLGVVISAGRVRLFIGNNENTPKGAPYEHRRDS